MDCVGDEPKSSGVQMSIEWHKVVLNNRRESLWRAERDLRRLQDKIVRDRVDFQFYENQVNCAIAEGLDGFDSERYGDAFINI